MEKICIKMVYIAQSYKNETTTMFFLKKPSLVSTAQTDLGLKSKTFSSKSFLHFLKSLKCANVYTFR